MPQLQKCLCVLWLLFTYTTTNAYVDLTYHNQPQIDALQREIESLKGDSLAVRKMVDWVALFADGDIKKPALLQEGLEMAEKLGMKNEMGIFYSDMAWMYFYRDEKEKTIEYFKKTIKYCEETELLIYAYGCLSNTNSWDGNHEQALEYALQGLEIAQRSGKKSLIADAYMFVGDVYKLKNEKQESKQYYTKAINYLDQNGDYFSILRLVTNVYDGDTSLIIPYNFFEYARVLKYQYEKASPRKKQLIVYNILKATQSYVSTTESEELKTVQLENQRKTTVFFAVIIVLLVAIAGLLVYQVNVKRKANKKLQEANEIKARIFVILNHDLRKPVATLVSYLDLKSTMPDALSKEQQKKLDDNIAEATNQLYIDMENLLLWARDQMQSFKPNYQYYSLSEIFKDIKGFFTYEKRISIEYEIGNNIYLRTDENYLKTIIRNLTLNAIEASLTVKKPVIWKAEKKDKNIIISIKNEGAKIDKEKIDLITQPHKSKISYKGTGLLIVRSLSESIHCRIEIETGKESGTTFKLIF